MSFPSSDVFAILLLSPLFHCCIVGPSIISSRLSVLYDCVPYAVQERHSGSSVCGWQPTSSGTHHCPGSISPLSVATYG
jgi:hypothetical protein